MNLIKRWNRFFHARTSDLWMGGMLRIGVALLYLADKMLWSLDIDWMISPSNGVASYHIGRRALTMHPDFMHTVFSLAPDSDLFFWTMHYLGLVHGIFLLFGIAPRIQALAILINLASFHHITDMVTDGQDVVFRIWVFFLLFLPLHHYTVYDLFRKSPRYEAETWPIWPFRLFQIEICFIYQGAGWSKLFDGPTWISGNAIWRLTHTFDSYGGMFNPEFIYNVLFPTKILTWFSLVIENICWILIWPLKTRWFILINMIILHVGIDLAMNMHCFEWLTILGWLTFFVLPVEDRHPAFVDAPTTTNGLSEVKERVSLRILANIFLMVLLTAYWAQTNSGLYLERAFPRFPLFAYYNAAADWVDSFTGPILMHMGIWQYQWSLFKESYNVNYQYFAVIKFENGTEEVWSSPHWESMTWLQKKILHRPVNYFDYLGNSGQDAIHDGFCRKLATDYGPFVSSITLESFWEAGPEEPPPDLGLFDYPARQPMAQRGRDRLYFYNINDDGHEECSLWAEHGECEANPAFMWRICIKSCREQQSGADESKHPETVSDDVSQEERKVERDEL